MKTRTGQNNPFQEDWEIEIANVKIKTWQTGVNHWPWYYFGLRTNHHYEKKVKKTYSRRLLVFSTISLWTSDLSPLNSIQLNLVYRFVKSVYCYRGFGNLL